MTIPHHEPGKPSFRETSKEALLFVLRPAVRWLSVMRVRPDTLTVVGWTLALGAAVLFGLGYARVAGLVMLLGGIFDALDGAVARETNRMSSFGAFLDSTVDRVGEGFMIGAIGLVFMRHDEMWALALAFAAIAGSFLVSYTRARAEALGLKGDVGFGSRAERVSVITTGLVLAPLHHLILPSVIALLAATAWLTVVQRILFVRKQLSGA